MKKIFKKIVLVVSEIYKKALEVQILNEVALSQLLVKILERSDKEKNTFKAIEKYRHGL